MPAPSRDRLRRPVDISTLFEGAARRVNLIVDEPGLRWAGLSGTKARNVSLSRSVGGNRNLYRPLPIGRVTRTESRGRARGGLSRTPLRDITAIVRAIERRRAEAPQEETNPPPPSNTSQLEQQMGDSTPVPAVAMKPQPSPLTTQVSNIMADSSSFVTPQKRLLDSIDKVREVWLQEQRKLERTPAAKKAEREKKVRILMSMH